MCEELERRTRAEFEDRDEATHLDYICSWVVSGKTVTQLMEEISRTVGLGDLSIGMLRRYLLATWPKDVDQRMADARRYGAHAKVEEAQHILEDVGAGALLGATREELTRAKMQADVRLWQAERHNKSELGRGDGVNIQINMNDMHLDAMRVRTVQLEQVKRERELELLSPARLISGAEESAHDIDYDIVEDNDAANVLHDNNLDLFAPDQTSGEAA